MSTVFVTGANGFIAQHMLQILLERGYTVIGSVRSSAKGDDLAAKLKSPKFSYAVVPDLIAEDAFDSVLKSHPEIEYFIHSASPLKMSADDLERDILVPAVEGTKNVLRAVKKHAPQVKKVVYTSSQAAISSIPRVNNDVETEASWNQITRELALTDGVLAYCASKTYAERAAWDFVKQEVPGFKLTTVNPPYVLGPQAFEADLASGAGVNVSNQVVTGLLSIKPTDPVSLGLEGYFVDVHKLALTHVLALEKPSTDGQRLLVANAEFCAQQILDIIHANFPQFAGKLPLGEPNKYAYNFPKIDNSKTTQVLGDLPQLSLEQTVVSILQQYLKYAPAA